jgi:phosphodiesterase/alkaline phosphatase D-like protein
MRTILVVHSVSMTTANVWIGITGVRENLPSIPLRLSDNTVRLASAEAWRPISGNGALPGAGVDTFFQVVPVAGLRPGAAMVVEANAARARFRTLPEALPPVGARPFSVVLSSCYFRNNDRGAAALVRAIVREVRPDVKFLAGDQVYLDFPSFFLGVPFDRAGKARLFLSKYLANWGDPNGLGALLAEGATWFAPDDHEYWNNFPNAATIISSTWTSGGRREYREVAEAFYREFQTDEPESVCRSFDVPPLEFMVLDARAHREEGDERFVTDDDLVVLTDWVANLAGPGILVLGQPLFVEPQTGFFGGFRRRLADRNLADYAQYAALADALVHAPHSVLVLAGDVHFPRVAQAMRPDNWSQGVFEVISSPTALVFGSHSETDDAPPRFPVRSSGVRRDVRTFGTSRHAGDNMVSLEFTAVGSSVRVRIKYWYIRASAPDGPVFEFSLN